MSVHKVEIAGWAGRPAGDIEEASRQFLQPGSGAEHRGWRLCGRRGRVAGQGQPRELALANRNVVRLIINRVVERDFAVAVTVDIAEPDILRARHLDCPRERLK